MGNYFPMFVDLTGRKTLVVGAGKIASGRIEKLLRFGAEMTVLSPDAPEELRRLAEAGRLKLILRAYEESFLEGQELVLAATDRAELNHEICAACRARGITVNNASDRRDCDFYFPALIEADGLTVGVSSGGTRHGEVREFCAKLRRFLAGERAAEEESEKGGKKE